MTDTTTTSGRQWIIDLVRDQFDPKPSDYRAAVDSWDDGAPAIADAIMANLPLLARDWGQTVVDACRARISGDNQQ